MHEIVSKTAELVGRVRYVTENAGRGDLSWLAPIPDEVNELAEEIDGLRQAWHGEGKPSHWKGHDEQVFGIVAEIMAAAMLREWGAPDWWHAPVFNRDFRLPVDRGGQPPWDLRLAARDGSSPDDWRRVVPGAEAGWNGVHIGSEVKATGFCEDSKWVARVKEEEYKPHPRLVIFATMMVSLDGMWYRCDDDTGRRRPARPRWMLPFHWIASKDVDRTAPTPAGEPLAPLKACRVFPFPGFRRSDRVTPRTQLGPELELLTRERLLSLAVVPPA